MYGQLLAALPGILHDRGLADIDHLFQHVQLAQPVLPDAGRQRLAQITLMLDVHVLHMAQPVVGESDTAPRERSMHPGTAVMAAHDHMLDAEDIDGELQHRQAVEVGVHDHVGDIAVNEQFARLQADDLVGWHPAVGAAYPEILGRLLARETLEEIGVAGDARGRPVAVVLEQAFQCPVIVAGVAHRYL
jgi:hypothetical protein